MVAVAVPAAVEADEGETMAGEDDGKGNNMAYTKEYGLYKRGK